MELGLDPSLSMQRAVEVALSTLQMRGHVQEQSRRNHKGAWYRALRGLCSPEKAWGLGRKVGTGFRVAMLLSENFDK